MLESGAGSIDRRALEHFDARKVGLCAGAMIAVFATMASSTIVNVAIPSLMRDFDASPFVAQFVLTGFLAAMTMTMLTIGWITGRWGIRKVLVAALLVFAAGSTLAAAAPSLNVVIAARALQGAAAGVVQPVALLALYLAFPPERRGTAVGLHALAIALAPALGPWLGGLAVEAFGWRYIFVVAVPIAVIAAAAAAAFVPRARHSEIRPDSFDAAGCAWLTVALSLLFIGAAEATRTADLAGSALAALAGGLACSIMFIRQELAAAAPIVQLRLLAKPPFAASCAVAFLLSAGLYGSTFIVPLFAQIVQQMSPARSGLLLLPAGLVLLVFAPAAGLLANRYPLAPLMALGIGVFAVSNLLFASVDRATGFIVLAAYLAIGRAGLGLASPLANLAALRVESDENAAQAAAIVSFSRQLGAMSGVAILSLMIGGAADASPAPPNTLDRFNAAFLVAAALLFAGLGAVWLYGRTARHRDLAMSRSSARLANAIEEFPIQEEGVPLADSFSSSREAPKNG